MTALLADQVETKKLLDHIEAGWLAAQEELEQILGANQ